MNIVSDQTPAKVARDTKYWDECAQAKTRFSSGDILLSPKCFKLSLLVVGLDNAANSVKHRLPQTSDIRHQTQQMMRMRNVVEQMGVSESQVRRCVGARATGVGCSLDWRGRRCAWAVRWRRIVDQSHNKCTKGWSRTLKITNIVLQISVHQLFGWSICPSSTFSKYKTGEYKVQSRWGGHRQWDPPTRSAPAWPGEEEEGRGFTGCTAAPPALDTPEHRKFKLLESPMRWASHCACQVNKLAIYRGRNSTHKKCWHKLAFFVARGVLAKLMMLHTNRRPHQCSVCNKAFVQKSYLTVHRWPQAAQQEPLAGVQISQLGWSDPDLCTLNTNCIYTHLCLSYCSPDKDWKSCVGHIMIMIITGIANVVTVGIVTVSHLSQLGLSLSWIQVLNCHSWDCHSWDSCNCNNNCWVANSGSQLSQVFGNVQAKCFVIVASGSRQSREGGCLGRAPGNIPHLHLSSLLIQMLYKIQVALKCWL